MTLRWLVTMGLLLELCFVSFFVVEGPDRVLLFMVVHMLVFLAGLHFVYHLRRSRTLITSGGSLLTAIMLFAVLFRVTVLWHDPVASDDIYRYVWDGRVAQHGFNPFALAPSDPRLDELHTEELPSKVNFPEMRTIYPPLAQGLFLLSHILFGPSILGLKALFVLLDLFSIVLLIALLRRLDLLPESVILYAWSPLPILYFGLDGHVDALGIPLLLGFLLFTLKKAKVAGPVSLGLAALAKVYPLFVVPFLLKAERGVGAVRAVLIPLALFAAGCVLYLESTGGLYESFLVFGSSWEFNGSVYNILKAMGLAGNTARMAAGALFLLLIVVLTFSRRPMIEKVFLGFLGLVLCAPVVHPWYLTWLAALVVLRWSLAVFILLGLSALSNFTVYFYQTTGHWQDYPLVILLQYVPVAVLLGWELLRGRFAVSRPELLYGDDRA